MKDYEAFFVETTNKKQFNTVGVCIESKHYMVNIDDKLKQIIGLIQRACYFVMNRPRQYGKTTTLHSLEKILKTRYKVLTLDFEGLGEAFESEEKFCRYFSKALIQTMHIKAEGANCFVDLIELIKWATSQSEMVLIIDEVDKASNNKLFLDFLGMLRALYLAREKGECTAFKSVILAGVYDIKNLKVKYSTETDMRYNSPWNIAIDFNVDMSFSSQEIGTMLEAYEVDYGLGLDISKLSKVIYKFTSGYPFLVSRVCQVVDEQVVQDVDRPWEENDVLRAIKIITYEKNTLFDDLIKNMENNQELYKCLYQLLVLNINMVFNINNPIIELGYMLGYLKCSKDNNVVVSNQILKEVIYNYMISKTDTTDMSIYNFKDNFITKDQGLDIEKILLRFQQFMKSHYSSKDVEFLGRQGVLLFLAFIKPIINGVGFEYKEVQLSEERRLDIVIQYYKHQYVIEAKIWHGEVVHQRGLKQLKEYLEIQGLEEGYLLIFNFNKNKTYTSNRYDIGKKIFEVMV